MSAAEDISKQENEGNSRLIARSGFIASAGLAFGKLATFLLNIMLSQILGTTVYGFYAIGRSFVGILKPFAHAGLDSGVVRYGAKYRSDGDEGKVLSTLYGTFLLSLGSSILIGGIFYILSPFLAKIVFFEPALTQVLQLFAILLPIYVMISTVGAVFQAFKQIPYQKLITNIVRPLLDIIVVSVVFLIGYRLEGALLGLILSGCSTLFLAGVLLYMRIPVYHRIQIPGMDQITTLLTYSLPVTLVSASYIIALRTDRLMLGIFDTASSVGVYNAAAVLALQIGIVHTGLVSIFAPIISDLYSGGKQKELIKNYNMVKRWAVYAAGGLYLPLVFYPRQLISIFGPEFVSGWALLVILPIGPILGAAAGPTGTLLKMAGNERVEFVNAIVLIISNILLNLILIPFFGVFGAATATIISQFLMNSIQLFQIRRSHGFFPLTSRTIAHLFFLFIILAVGIGMNIYTSLLQRTLVFVATTIVYGLIGYFGHTQLDRQALNNLLPNVVLDYLS